MYSESNFGMALAPLLYGAMAPLAAPDNQYVVRIPNDLYVALNENSSVYGGDKVNDQFAQSSAASFVCGCGSKNTFDANFCSNCGKSLVASRQATVTDGQESNYVAIYENQDE